MADSKRTVLITGCSDGGMGAELAKEFHKAGLRVYATARDSSKMKELASLGIETLPLDIQSESSIKECVAKIPRLDILVNNAGAQYTMPIADMSLVKAKKTFDINVWGHIAVSQAFIPLLIKSPKAVLVNHTSVGADTAIPFQSAYNASKAAMAMFSDALRLELQPFGIAVVNLKTGGVNTNIIKNVQAQHNELPEGSIYTPAKDVLNKALRIEWAEGVGIPAQQWAAAVVADLLKKNPPPNIWRGKSASLAWVAGFLPYGSFDGMFKRLTGMDKVESIIKKK